MSKGRTLCRLARKKTGMNMSDFASFCGYKSYKNISGIEQSKTYPSPQANLLFKLIINSDQALELLIRNFIENKIGVSTKCSKN